jgi:hypothetical protein
MIFQTKNINKLKLNNNEEIVLEKKVSALCHDHKYMYIYYEKRISLKIAKFK